MGKITKEELTEMWKRPVERQYNVAISKMLEAIAATDGDITICFSGGKDSTLMLDMYCDIIRNTKYADKPIKVAFADTTNENVCTYKFVNEFIERCRVKYGVKIDFTVTRPDNNIVWVNFVREEGIPLITKKQAKFIRYIK